MVMKTALVADENDREVRNRNLRHAFHETRKVYISLAQRALHSRIFLPRNLLRLNKHPISHDTILPNVTYRSVEMGVSWQTVRNDLRCLWCKSHFFRFVDAKELVHHLQTCHGMLQYSLEPQNSANDKDTITVNVSLLRDTQDAPRKRQEPLLRTFMFEKTLVNKRKRKQSSSKCPVTATNNNFKEEGPEIKRLRPRRSCRMVRPHYGFDLGDANSSSELRPMSAPPTGRATPSVNDPFGGGSASISADLATAAEHLRRTRRLVRSNSRKGQQAKRVTGKRGRHRKKPAFRSVEEGMHQDRLFHSVVQTRLHKEQFEMEDSDNDVEAEQGWRFRLRHDEIVEYLDTIPVEKLFMNLWNQFVGMEFRIDSDRRVANACAAFVEKYHLTLKRMKMEITFLRHLSEMARIGLLDSDDVFKCVLRLRELEQSSDQKPEPRFIYEEELLSQMRQETREAHKKEDE